MFRISPIRTRQKKEEAGYILIAVLFAVTLMIIALAAALPAIRTQIQRDHEDELVHRGKQYVRAIQLYYRKFGRYPSSIDDLKNTNNLRFLRKEYTDPITGKNEWRLIHYGEAQPKPIPAYLQRGNSAGGSGGFGGTGGTPAGNISGGSSAQGAGNGATNASDMSRRIGNSTTTTGGIGPIVGVSSTSEKQGLKEIDGKTKYSDWEFVYDPSLDASRVNQNGQGQGAGNGNNNRNNGPVNNAPNTPRPPGPNR
jgi:type II secretory pathway pseudopilin PulG